MFLKKCSQPGANAASASERPPQRADAQPGRWGPDHCPARKHPGQTRGPSATAPTGGKTWNQNGGARPVAPGRQPRGGSAWRRRSQLLRRRAAPAGLDGRLDGVGAAAAFRAVRAERKDHLGGRRLAHLQSCRGRGRHPRSLPRGAQRKRLGGPGAAGGAPRSGGPGAHAAGTGARRP